MYIGFLLLKYLFHFEEILLCGIHLFCKSVKNCFSEQVFSIIICSDEYFAAVFFNKHTEKTLKLQIQVQQV